MSDTLTPHVGFPLSDAMQQKANRFLEAVAAKDKRAGALFVDVIEQLTAEIIDTLLVQTVTIAQISPMGQKVFNMCASTGNKASSMLTTRIYKDADLGELQQVANFWQGMIKNSKADNSGLWYLATPIDGTLSAALDSILNEKDSSGAYAPRDVEDMARKYDQLMTTIIDHFFLRPAQFVDMGMITRKMMNLSVDGVKQASHAVLHKVVKKLEPTPLAAYVDHTARLYVKLP